MKTLRQILYNMVHPKIGAIWQLHRVSDEVSENEEMRRYEIMPKKLTDLIEAALHKEYHFISVDQYFAMMQKERYDKKFIVVTLDDGYADNCEIAYPIFKKYNIPFCIFVTKNYVQQGQKPYRYLTLEQIQKLNNEPLCTFGSHTISHPSLHTLTQEDMLEEIQTCKEWLEQVTQKPMDYFAYPYGSYNSETIDVVRHLNIKMAFAAWGGEIRKGKTVDHYRVPRVLITQSSII